MNVKVLHPSDVVWASPHGTIDFEAGSSLLGTIATAAEPLKDYDVLIDLRRSSSELRPQDLWDLAASLVRYRGTFLHRTAILCPPAHYEQARSFAQMAASHGFARIRPFVGHEDAINWLMAGAD